MAMPQRDDPPTPRLRSIANLGGDDKLVQKDKLGLFLWKPFRSDDTEKRNNAVRTELLKALAQAFGLEGVTEHDGKTMFSDEFMNRLSDLLGPAFKRGDFGIKDGVVASGKPLTQRRITAIFKAAAIVKAETPYDAKTYLAKVDSLEDVLKTKDPNAQTTITGLDYAKSFKLTIAFIENDLPGFDRARPRAIQKDQPRRGCPLGGERRLRAERYGKPRSGNRSVNGAEARAR